MKRSEMISLLQTSFLFHMNPPVECCSGDEEMYSHILSDLEDVGILPPAISIPPTRGRFFQWEDETVSRSINPEYHRKIMKKWSKE